VAAAVRGRGARSRGARGPRRARRAHAAWRAAGRRGPGVRARARRPRARAGRARHQLQAGPARPGAGARAWRRAWHARVHTCSHNAAGHCAHRAHVIELCRHARQRVRRALFACVSSSTILPCLQHISGVVSQGCQERHCRARVQRLFREQPCKWGEAPPARTCETGTRWERMRARRRCPRCRRCCRRRRSPRRRSACPGAWPRRPAARATTPVTPPRPRSRGRPPGRRSTATRPRRRAGACACSCAPALCRRPAAAPFGAPRAFPAQPLPRAQRPGDIAAAQPRMPGLQAGRMSRLSKPAGGRPPSPCSCLTELQSATSRDLGSCCLLEHGL
jgi:hypothetical protein